jgi:tetratricopeptide (TPR) repeat protein
MSESDEQSKPPRRAGKVWHQRAVVLRRDDHVGDPIGLIFLEDARTISDRIIARLRDYFGPRVRIVKAEVSHEEIVAHVESRGWHDESNRLAAAAAELNRKGARRNAQAMYREALEIDPLNGDAMLSLGLALADAEKFAEALALLKRARECQGADTVDMLTAMAKCAARLQRAASAVIYLERAYELDPRNFMVRSALRALGRDPSQGGSGGASSGGAVNSGES